mgnify:CR=1 FL=1
MIRRLCVTLSYLALAGTLLAPLLYFWDALDKPAMKTVMTVTTLVWFVCGGAVRARALSSS